MPRKQSSPRLSTIAARVMAQTRFQDALAFGVYANDDIKALCASVLSQDETKGQKRAIRKRK